MRMITGEPYSNQPPGLAPAYAGFFACFNRGEYFEAHRVLESLWLRLRRDPRGDFFKGLIQVAGAFLHLEKGRRSPALRLFDLADRHLAQYPEVFEYLDVRATRQFIRQWKIALEQPGLPIDLGSVRPRPQFRYAPESQILSLHSRG